MTHDSAPVAILIEETKRGQSAIMCGQMFKRMGTAAAAAKRLSNSWRKCVAVPVYRVRDHSADAGKVVGPGAWCPAEHLAKANREITRLRAALEPFALHIRPEVPDDEAIETVCWTAGQHRAARAALNEGAAHG